MEDREVDEQFVPLDGRLDWRLGTGTQTRGVVDEESRLMDRVNSIVTVAIAVVHVVCRWWKVHMPSTCGSEITWLGSGKHPFGFFCFLLASLRRTAKHALSNS